MDNRDHRLPTRGVVSWAGLFTSDCDCYCALFSLLAKFRVSPDKRFVEWPRAEGRVVSSTKFDGDSVVSYVFHLGDQTFGRYARVKASGVTKTYSNDEKVTIAYDPLNPDQSKLIL
jgi:hypothetical protein